MSPRSRRGSARDSAPMRREKSRSPPPGRPAQLAPAQQEDPAQHERRAPIRVGLGVGQRKGAAPAPAENDPPVDAEVLAELLDVRHEIPGGVLPELREGRALTAAALVVQHDAPFLRIKGTVVERFDAAARAAVQEDERLAARVAALLEVDRVQLRDLQISRAVRIRSWERNRVGPSSSISCPQRDHGRLVRLAPMKRGATDIPRFSTASVRAGRT